jgi:hypothetical protein
MTEDSKVADSAVPGLAILCLFATGVAGIIHAFLTGSGLSIMGSAIAFGVVAHISFKKQ